MDFPSCFLICIYFTSITIDEKFYFLAYFSPNSYCINNLMPLEVLSEMPIKPI